MSSLPSKSGCCKSTGNLRSGRKPAGTRKFGIRTGKKLVGDSVQGKIKLKERKKVPNDEVYQEKLDKSLRHLPFFHSDYNRAKVLQRLAKVKPICGILKYGRYYIEGDWTNRLDPRTEPNLLVKLELIDRLRRKRLKADGAVNRIVDLFMNKALSWHRSKDWQGRDSIPRSTTLALLWLGPNLAKKMMNEVCVVKNPSHICQHESRHLTVESDFYLINRLPVDAFFADKEAFYYILKDYILSPSLVCKAPATNDYLGAGDGFAKTCQNLEKQGLLSRCICPHQNLSLSIKPCLVPNCQSYKRPVCKHIYAFIPETISISSYMSMLQFAHRFGRVEDLKGCVFITKPAYLSNGRGINFLFERSQFEYFYHMLDRKGTSRHGIVLQRYIENPRLFDSQKFTVRFFLLIVVLPHRRVVGFIHYGLAIFCSVPYQSVTRQNFPPEEETLEGRMPDYKVPISCRTIGRVENRNWNRFAHLASYREPQFRVQLARSIKTGQGVERHKDEDNVFYLHDILPSKCPSSTSIYIQMLFIGQCIMNYMQPVIHDFPGSFQTVSVDSLVDSRNKLWVLEGGTKIFSGLLKIFPRQRSIMSAIIQESLGVTIECFYKTQRGLPLFWNYKTSAYDYNAFHFSQDFNLFYETHIAKQTGFADHKWRTQQPQLSLEQSLHMVDVMRDKAMMRKKEYEITRNRVAMQKKKRSCTTFARVKGDEKC